MSDKKVHSIHGAMTKQDYEDIRREDEERVRRELSQESEKDRQKREYIEANRRRREGLG